VSSEIDKHSIAADDIGKPRHRAEALNQQKFQKLIAYANQNSPYYARLIEERGLDVETCTHVDFPVLTKTILMANFDDIVTDRRITKQGIADFLTRSADPKDLLFNKYTVMHTSGTSGEVGYFLNTAADQRRSYRGMMRRRKSMRSGVKRWPIKGIRRMRMAFYGATGGTMLV
jgi:phenylacetate-coenzyme A ligase PaaK-like adenylate-forming protein